MGIDYKKFVYLRKAAGLNQGDIAALLGKERTSVSKKERGKTPLTIKELEIIIPALRKALPNNEELNRFIKESFGVTQPVERSEKMELIERRFLNIEERITRLENKIDNLTNLLNNENVLKNLQRLTGTNN